MITLTSEQDRKQLKEYALELIKNHELEGLVILVEVLKDLDPDVEIRAPELCLCTAAFKGHLEVVKYLVSKGADVRWKSSRALQRAARMGHLNIVKYLVEVGSNIHADDDFAIAEATKMGHLEVVKYLVEQGSNLSSYGNRAVHNAIENGREDVLEYLKQLNLKRAFKLFKC